MIALVAWLIASTLIAAGVLMSDDWEAWSTSTKCVMGVLLALAFPVLVALISAWTLLEKVLKSGTAERER